MLATPVKGDWQIQMAPGFDHGTSLAYQIRDQDLERESTPTAINRFVDHALGAHAEQADMWQICHEP